MPESPTGCRECAGLSPAALARMEARHARYPEARDHRALLLAASASTRR